MMADGLHGKDTGAVFDICKLGTGGLHSTNSLWLIEMAPQSKQDRVLRSYLNCVHLQSVNIPLSVLELSTMEW